MDITHFVGLRVDEHGQQGDEHLEPDDDGRDEEDERSAASQASNNNRAESEDSYYKGDGRDYDKVHAVNDMSHYEEDGKVAARDVHHEL